MIKGQKVTLLILFTSLFTLSFTLSAFAGPADGTIDPTYKYAWGENVGWVNFAADTGNVHITDAGLTGYIWDSIYGWINLNPTNAGVKNDSFGHLSGKAWSEGRGFIDFSGVVINSSGQFVGQASGPVFGRLNFNCVGCVVLTDYRPINSRRHSRPTYGPVSSSTPEEVPIVPTVPEIVTPPASSTPIALPPEVITEINNQNNATATSTPSITERALTEFELLLAHFPAFKNILVQLGVNVNQESEALKKITNINFSLSGFVDASISLINSLGIHVPYALNQLSSKLIGSPLASIPEDIKKNIPEDVVFTRSGDSNIDIPVNIKVSQKGQLNQSIETTANRTITLAIRPSGKKVDSIIGYLVFKNDFSLNTTKPVSINKNLLSDLIDIAYAETSSSTDSISDISNAEDLMVLNKFEYTDPDHDGLYTANVRTPYSMGEYEIVTVINYKDRSSPKVLRLITIIDPEGYIYQSSGANETRIRNATVSMFQLNDMTNKYELWKAIPFAQKNPQTTDQTGAYSFLVPEGTYRLQVEAKGYDTYLSDPFTAAEGDTLHGNIELFPTRFKLGNYWMLIVFMIIAGILFYQRRYHIIHNNK